MHKKIIAGTGIAVTTALLAVAWVAGAQPTGSTSTPAAASAPAVATQPQILSVNAAGRVLLRGTIASVSSGSMTVNGWGGTWTVNIPASAEVLPAAAAGSYATAFQTGDFVGVEGTVATNAAWTVNATVVSDWTYRAALNGQEKANVQAARGIRTSGPRDYVGTASGVNGSSLTLTAANGTTYTVNAAANAEVVNRNWATMPFANIQSGDNVRVYGVNASGTVTAQIVRDVTIPARTAAAPSSTGQ